MIMSPTVALALSQSRPEKLGEASGISTATRQFASTMGIAIMTATYHGTIHATGSTAKGFSAISLVAALCAILGFFMVFFLVTQKNQLRVS